MNALCRLYAIGAPNRNPRDSRPAIASNSTPSSSAVISSTARWKPSASPSTVVISRKMMPSFGKSGMLVIYCSTLLMKPQFPPYPCRPAENQLCCFVIWQAKQQYTYILSNRVVCDKRLIVRNVDFYHEDYCRYTNPHQIVHYRIWSGRRPDDWAVHRTRGGGQLVDPVVTDGT